MSHKVLYINLLFCWKANQFLIGIVRNNSTYFYSRYIYRWLNLLFKVLFIVLLHCSLTIHFYSRPIQTVSVNGSERNGGCTWRLRSSLFFISDFKLLLPPDPALTLLLLWNFFKKQFWWSTFQKLTHLIRSKFVGNLWGQFICSSLLHLLVFLFLILRTVTIK